MKFSKVIVVIVHGLLALCMLNGAVVTAAGLYYAACTAYTIGMKKAVNKISPTTRL